MAIYHFHDSVISRGKGQSVVAAAAYQSRARLYNERDGETKDYSQKVGQDCLFSGVYVPKDAPEWAKDPERLWNATERAEDQHNKTRAQSATLAHRLDIGLMAELTPEQNRYALQDFIRETYVRRGYGVQASVHGPEQGGDARNIHAHLLVTIRTLDGEGLSAEKPRLDRNQMKQQVRQWRESWAKTASRHLERAGHHEAAERMASSHLTLEEQRQAALKRGDRAHAKALAREPTEHQGPKATRLERDGLKTEAGDRNRAVQEENNRRQELERLREQTEREIAELEAQQEAERQRRAEEERQKAARAGQEPPSPAASWWQASHARAAMHAPIPAPSNDNQQNTPEAPPKRREHVPRTPTARAFERAQQPEKAPQPEPPRRRTEQRETFNKAAQPHAEPAKAQDSRLDRILREREERQRRERQEEREQGRSLADEWQDRLRKGPR